MSASLNLLNDAVLFYLSPKEAFPKPKAAAQKALEIDPSLADAHAALALRLLLTIGVG